MIESIRIRIFVILIACLLPVGCVFYPRQVEQYDADCEIKYKKLVLEQNELRGIRINCTNEGCIAALLLIPIEAIVAGSIVVVGNTIYWLEKEGRCLLKTDE